MYHKGEFIRWGDCDLVVKAHLKPHEGDPDSIVNIGFNSEADAFECAQHLHMIEKRDVVLEDSYGFIIYPEDKKDHRLRLGGKTIEDMEKELC